MWEGIWGIYPSGSPQPHEHYPKDAFGILRYDKKLIDELDMKTMDVTCASTILEIKRRSSSTIVCFATSYKAHMCASVNI